ncbi:MAG: succinylglutamate desuccinylase, partial [Synergistaceae bacterium]
MEYRVKGNKYTAILLCVFVAVICFLSARSFLEMKKPDVLVPAPGFVQHMLSEWEPGLKGTNADTPVYIQDG